MTVVQNENMRRHVIIIYFLVFRYIYIYKKKTRNKKIL